MHGRWLTRAQTRACGRGGPGGAGRGPSRHVGRSGQVASAAGGVLFGKAEREARSVRIRFIGGTPHEKGTPCRSARRQLSARRDGVQTEHSSRCAVRVPVAADAARVSVTLSGRDDSDDVGECVSGLNILIRRDSHRGQIARFCFPFPSETLASTPTRPDPGRRHRPPPLATYCISPNQRVALPIPGSRRLPALLPAPTPRSAQSPHFDSHPISSPALPSRLLRGPISHI